MTYSLTGICHLGTLSQVDSQTFAAVGQPNRLQIVELLRKGPLSVGEIVEKLALRQPQVSKHLKVLDEAGIVSWTPLARRRVYRLEAKPFEQINGWAESFEMLWEARLDSLGTYLGEGES